MEEKKEKIGKKKSEETVINLKKIGLRGQRFLSDKLRELRVNYHFSLGREMGKKT